MRLGRLQDYLKEKGWNYRYTEEDGCGSLDWEYRGIIYHVWEFSGNGAESNVRSAGKMEDYFDDYEAQIIKVMEDWK